MKMALQENISANFAIQIADFNILVYTNNKNISLISESILENFIVGTKRHFDLSIEVHHKIPIEFIESKEIFKAPYIEEIDGVKKTLSPNFWSVHKFRDKFIVITSSLKSLNLPNLALSFDIKSAKWDIYSNQQIQQINPFEYPMLPLVLFYLVIKNNAIMIHASGIKNEGKGIIFSGFSGAGKSTMANLWQKYHAEIIHDDRLIIRKISGEYFMYNTPVYENDYSKKCKLDNIFLINHNKKNISKKLEGVTAISRLMAFCIQHNYHEEIIRKMLNVISDICRKTPIYELGFVPDNSVIQYIKENYLEQKAR